MKIKHLFWTIILNIFLMLAISVMLEYNDLASRFTHLENNVSSALESAVDVAMASEELFTEKGVEKIYSQASNLHKVGSTEKSSGTVEQSVLLFSNKTVKTNDKGVTSVTDNWFSCNPYVLASYCWNKDKGSGSCLYTDLPDASQYSSYESDFYSERQFKDYPQEAAYEWLFGKVGSAYNNSSLTWSSTNENTKNETNTQKYENLTFTESRVVNEEFKSFYDKIGSKIKTYGPLKVKSGNSFKVSNVEYPTLCSMGLELDDWNKTNNEKMSDNFIMVRHVGKTRVKTGTGTAVKKSVYYLTPYSLGVTYVPVKVTKPVFMAHLAEIVRLNNFREDPNSKKGAIYSALNDPVKGCIPTSVYESGTVTEKDEVTDEDVEKTVYSHQSHTGKNEYSHIINDGEIEYDMNTIQMKVDYTVVDFYKDVKDNAADSLARVGNKVFGAIADHGDDDFTLIDKLKDTDTGLRYYKKFATSGSSDGEKYANGSRLVAKITVRMKVYIPFKNGILQWARYMEGKNIATEKNNHMGLRSLEILKDDKGSTTGSYKLSEDGVWFEYSTYRCVAR